MRTIVIARKSLDGSVASNALKHGTGTLNVGGCRIGKGRWPANIIVKYKPGCKVVGTRTVKSGTAVRRRSGGKTIFSETSKPPMDDMTYGGPDGESVNVWSCAEGCPAGSFGESSRFFKQVEVTNMSYAKTNTALRRLHSELDLESQDGVIDALDDLLRASGKERLCAKLSVLRQDAETIEELENEIVAQDEEIDKERKTVRELRQKLEQHKAKKDD